MKELTYTAESAAPPERIWELLADVTSWPRWTPFEHTYLEARGRSLPEGVGALRRLHAGKLITRERIVAYEPPRRLVLESVRGLPVRRSATEVTLERLGNGGTRVEWVTRFAPRRPWRADEALRTLDALVGGLAERVARAAEQWEPGLGETRPRTSLAA